MTLELSPKQSLLYHLDKHSHDIVIADGVVRSGKTVAGLIGLFDHSRKYFANGRFLVGVYADNTWSGAIRRTKQLYEAATGRAIYMNHKEMVVPSDLGGPNIFARVTCKGIDAVSRIQGDTIAGVFATEVVKFPEELLYEFGFRTTNVPGRKLIYDCNPEYEAHWFYQNYILRASEINALHLRFNEGDNPTMSRAAWEQIKRETPPGPMYERRINGVWCNAAGQVWPNICLALPPTQKKPRTLKVGIDVATSSVTHAVLVEEYVDADYVIDEWRWDATKQGELHPAQQIEAMAGQFYGYANRIGVPIHKWVLDSGGQGASFAATLKQAKGSQVLSGQLKKAFKPKGSVLIGINHVAHRFNTRTLYISPHAKMTVKECQGYVWAERQADQGEDAPEKKDDHACDALRYLVVDDYRSRHQARVSQVQRIKPKGRPKRWLSI